MFQSSLRSPVDMNGLVVEDRSERRGRLEVK